MSSTQTNSIAQPQQTLIRKIKNVKKLVFKKENETSQEEEKTSPNHNLKILEEYISTYYPSLKGSDFKTLINAIYMEGQVRNNIDMEVLLEDLYIGILDLDKFRAANGGNIYHFIKPIYVEFARCIKDITVGSNGGMANVGKVEWLISIGSGIDPEKNTPRVSIIKNGKGDLLFEDSKDTEEAKWNGGKVSVEKKGDEINKKFNTMISIDDKGWVPFRKGDKPKYSEQEIQRFNAVYWNAISGEDNASMSNDELKKKIINMSFQKVFEKSDTFIMFNDDGKFQRFHNTNEANMYYQDKLPQLKGSKGFECRASKSNPIAMYCFVL